MGDNMLHQLIAVEPDLAAQARAIMEETINTFTKKAEHFDGVQKLYKPYEEGGEQIPEETKEVVTTVREKLDYAKTIVIKSMDATISKEETNASGTARANLTVNGVDFGDFSATSLIALIRTLEKIREEYKAIPTLDPTKSWVKADTTGKMLYETPVEVKFRAVKTKVPLVLSPATDKFPAQVQVYDSDKQVGKYETTYRSGRITPTEKSNLLAKIDDLVLAAKKAREKANQTKAIQIEVGKKIFDFIHG